jgi:hypothetical protein
VDAGGYGTVRIGIIAICYRNVNASGLVFLQGIFWEIFPADHEKTHGRKSQNRIPARAFSPTARLRGRQ